MPARSSGRGLFQESSRTPYSRPSAASFAGDSSSKPLSKGRQKTPLTRNIVVVKLDGGEKGGGRTYAIKGYLKVKVDAPAPISLSGITAVVERAAEKQGVRGDLLLLDKWGYPFPDDMVGQDWEPPHLKILAAPRENYEQHFGSSSLSLGDKLLHTPEKPKAAKRAAGKTRSNPRKGYHAHVGGSSADDDDEEKLSEIARVVQEVNKTTRQIMERLDGLVHTTAALLDSIEPPKSAQPRSASPASVLSASTQDVVSDSDSIPSLPSPLPAISWSHKSN